MIRYGPKRWPAWKRNGRSAGSPAVADENDRVIPSEDHIASKSVSPEDAPPPGAFAEALMGTSESWEG